jgi:hypothetical protein
MVGENQTKRMAKKPDYGKFSIPIVHVNIEASMFTTLFSHCHLRKGKWSSVVAEAQRYFRSYWWERRTSHLLEIDTKNIIMSCSYGSGRSIPVQSTSGLALVSPMSTERAIFWLAKLIIGQSRTCLSPEIFWQSCVLTVYVDSNGQLLQRTKRWFPVVICWKFPQMTSIRSERSNLYTIEL